jgi:hypothetical protein
MPRLEVIYLALQSTRAQELFLTLGRGELMPAARNGAVRDLARIVDEALAAELARRAGGAPG